MTAPREATYCVSPAPRASLIAGPGAAAEWKLAELAGGRLGVSAAEVSLERLRDSYTNFVYRATASGRSIVLKHSDNVASLSGRHLPEAHICVEYEFLRAAAEVDEPGIRFADCAGLRRAIEYRPDVRSGARRPAAAPGQSRSGAGCFGVTRAGAISARGSCKTMAARLDLPSRKRAQQLRLVYVQVRGMVDAAARLDERLSVRQARSSGAHRGGFYAAELPRVRHKHGSIRFRLRFAGRSTDRLGELPEPHSVSGCAWADFKGNASTLSTAFWMATLMEISPAWSTMAQGGKPSAPTWRLCCITGARGTMTRRPRFRRRRCADWCTAGITRHGRSCETISSTA